MKILTGNLINLIVLYCTKCFLRELSRECAELTSKKNPSILRKTTTDDIRKFELRKVCEGLKNRAPLYYSMLLTSAVPSRKKDMISSPDFFPSVAVAGSILLRERCMFLNATQIMVSLVLKFSAIQVCMIDYCHCLLSPDNRYA